MSTAADPSPIQIREIASTGELRAVEQMQKEVWGIPDLDVVPLYHLIAAQTSGGILLGAFDADEMAGFVYGFVGQERGRTVHHSHMLAVRSEYRSRNLGFLLKLEQRKRVMDQGIDVMTWTFDPLRSHNAYFNFTKLGVIADRYYRNFYGEEASSFLHANGTDRFWVTWQLAHPRVVEKIEGRSQDPSTALLPVLVSVGDQGAPMVHDIETAFTSSSFVIEIPEDIGKVETDDPETGRQWRAATCDAFSKALDVGYMVEDFIRADRAGKKLGAYVLSRDKALVAW